MKKRQKMTTTFIAVQLVVAAFLAASWAGTARRANRSTKSGLFAKSRFQDVPVSPTAPFRATSLYNDPRVVTDADLLMVLKKIQPRFSRKQLKPNFLEHALRTWSVNATFTDPAVMSGKEMVDVLVDHAKYVQSWSQEIDPLLLEQEHGVSVRWGHAAGASVHHDHLLASLTEAGLDLNTEIFLPSGNTRTFNDLLQQSFRDFRLDEREVEWSAMAFASWFGPSMNSWWTSDGRKMSFDLIAQRLMRGHSRFGVCNGTHRVYSLAFLLRLNEKHDVLSEATARKVRMHLRTIRDRLMVTQFPDGHWPSNWANGIPSRKNQIQDPDYKKVIATGHHLEWLAIAPKEFQPPREMVRKAAAWLIRNVRNHKQEHILKRYTFYSHVGSALAAWRGTTPYEFWQSQQVKRTNHAHRSE
ncbi:MAG: hypothetical protein Tsb009_29050 [Planctomycetaceae bacterium]